jgi:2-polyprenyl-3-methyl-5-hydroxy-6-metoxy-1,4-benzoquinol methylase
MQGSGIDFDVGAAVNWGRAYHHYLRGWLPKKKDAAILDVACGGGKLLYFLKSLGYTNLEGVDVSPEQVALTRQIIENVVEGDALDFLKSRTASYDLIIGLDIIEHFKKDEVLQFLDGCYNALRLPGRLVLQTTNSESPWGSHYRYDDFTHEVSFSPKSLERLLALTGFSHVVSRSAGPVVYGISSLGRYIIWQFIKAGLALWNLAEMGRKGGGVYTRIFFITGKRDKE